VNGFELLSISSLGVIIISLFLVRHLRTWLGSWRMVKRKGGYVHIKGNPGGIIGIAILLSYLLLFVNLVIGAGVLLISLLVMSGNVGLASLLLNMGSNAAYTEGSPYGYTYISPSINYTLARIYGGGMEAMIAALILILMAALIQLIITRIQSPISGNPNEANRWH